MSEKKSSLSENELRALLSSQGLRVTGQRMSILRKLARLRRPASHPELTELLAADALDRATIYRNLVALSDAGLLVRTQLGDAVWRYELPESLSAAHGKHPHFVCTECGEVICLESRAITFHGEIAIDQVTEVQVRGRCSDCVRA